jgi:hypothetical protein
MSGSHRKTLAMAIAWWYVRRMIRRRGHAAVAGLLAGEGLTLGREKPKRHVFAFMLVLGVVAGAVLFWWWRRQQEGGDDWGDWEPADPVVPPMPSEPVTPPAPDPLPDPVAT